MVRVVAAALLSGAAAQSFTSCNTEAAHMKNFQITSSPDPPVLGEDVTFTITGALDKQITAGAVDINIKAGPINFPLTIPFQRNAVDPSAFVAGQDTTITLGPFTYPNIKVPLIKTTSGKFEVVDQDEEQVSCAEFTLPAYSETAPTSKFTAGDAPFVDFSGASAHIGNKQLDVEPPTISKGVPFTVHGSGDLDEDITSGTADFNVDVSLFKLAMSVPFAVSSPAKAGHADVTIGPITMPSIPLIPNAKGSIKVADANAEEVICYNFNVPVAEAVAV
jgi:hypothetical protein